MVIFIIVEVVIDIAALLALGLAKLEVPQHAASCQCQQRDDAQCSIAAGLFFGRFGNGRLCRHNGRFRRDIDDFRLFDLALIHDAEDCR